MLRRLRILKGVFGWEDAGLIVLGALVTKDWDNVG